MPELPEVSALVGHLDLPAAGRLAAWGNAYLCGRVSPDATAESVAGGVDAAHRVTGLPGEGAAVSLPYALGRLRALGVHALRLVLPRPGDVLGLPGPADFNGRAVEHGAAVLTVGGTTALGLLEETRGAWTAHPVEAGAPAAATPAEVERELREVLQDATEDLVRLDVARWHPAAVELLGGSGGARTSPLPPSASARAVALVDRAQRLLAIVAVARADDGASVSAAEMAARRGVLRRLDTASRRAMEAGCGDTGG